MDKPPAQEKTVHQEDLESYGHFPTPDWESDDNPTMPTKVRDLFVWKSPSHIHRIYPKEFFTTLGAIGLLLSIIFAFFQEWFAILVVWAAYFLFWVTTRTQPQELEHKITTQGIVSLNRSYLWSEFGPFWFSEKHGETQLHIAYRNVLGQLIFILSKDEEEIIRDILAHYIPFIETYEKSTMDKISDWMGKRLAFDKGIPGKNNESLAHRPQEHLADKPYEKIIHENEPVTVLSETTREMAKDEQLVPDYKQPEEQVQTEKLEQRKLPSLDEILADIKNEASKKSSQAPSTT